MMRFSYYPGCSLHSTGKEYGESTEATCQALGIELVEIVDWNCCGASAAHSLNHELAIQLSGRNLLLAQSSGLDLAVPCSACYHNLKLAEEELKLNNSPPVRHILDILAKEIERVKQMVKKPLANLKVVPYYGCLIT
ncbi:heterodisulfide reductase subunit B, partial [bacterium]|nr:heterodisulfide reductase subunit B [bacterium]